MTTWTRDGLVELTKQIANSHGLDTSVVCGIAEQESSWYTFSIRWEPDFYARYVAPIIPHFNLSHTEAEARAISWGLGQVMGQVARELGFSGVSLAELCDPPAGIEWLCRVFEHKLKEAAGNVNKALELYNGGSNLMYSAQVMDRSQRYRT